MISLRRGVTGLVDRYRKRPAPVYELLNKTAEISGSATAPRRAVKVTANAAGAITGVEFPSTAYRWMLPAELADVLVATIKEAQHAALTAVAETALAEFARLEGDGSGEPAPWPAAGPLPTGAPGEGDVTDIAPRRSSAGPLPRKSSWPHRPRLGRGHRGPAALRHCPDDVQP